MVDINAKYFKNNNYQENCASSKHERALFRVMTFKEMCTAAVAPKKQGVIFKRRLRDSYFFFSFSIAVGFSHCSQRSYTVKWVEL